MTNAINVFQSIGIDSKSKLQAINANYRLPVFVIFTSIDRTLKALEKACEVAKPLQTRIEILVVQTVPYLLPLDDPSVPLEFIVKRLEEATAQFPEQIKISAYLCRDLLEALKRVLNRNCPVVIGIGKKWWPTSDERLARKLRRAGYDVVLVETE
jgi:hypothetical protein